MSGDSAQGARLLAGALCVSVLAGCAGHQALRDLDRTTGHLPETAQVAGVPFHGQRDYQCGPASMAMMLQSSGVDASVDELIPQIFLPGRQGSVQPEMLAAARRHGRVPFVLEGGLPAVFEEIDAGHPVLVLQNLSLPAFPMWHYAVVTGYDLERRHVRLHTGETPDRDTALRRFLNTWARSGHWAAVVLEPGGLPAAIAPRNAFQAINDFERVAGAADAVPAWRAAASRWEGEHLGWFGLGNALYASGETDGARDAFQRAVGVEPGFGPGWINLGHVRLELGEREAGIEALRRAAGLDGPWQEAAIRSLSDLH